MLVRVSAQYAISRRSQRDAGAVSGATTIRRRKKPIAVAGRSARIRQKNTTELCSP